MAMMPFSSGINDVDRQTLRPSGVLALTATYYPTEMLATGLIKTLVIQTKVENVGGGLTDLLVRVETALDAAATDWCVVQTHAIAAGVVTPSPFTYTVAAPAAQSYLTYVSGATLGLYTRVQVQATFGGAQPTVSVYALRKQVA